MAEVNHTIELSEEVQQMLSDAVAKVGELRSKGDLPPLFAYPEFVAKLFKEMENVPSTLHHAATGLAGEGGEVLDVSKKHWAYGKDLDVAHLLEELSDVRFYYQAVLNMLGITDDMILTLNMEKLQKRYPTGVYSDEHAIARLDKGGEQYDS